MTKYLLMSILFLRMLSAVNTDPLRPSKEKLEELSLKGAAIIQKSLLLQNATDLQKNNGTIGVVTLSTPDRKRSEFSSITLKSIADYCKKWGYNYHEYRHLFGISRPAQWAKIRALQDVMQKNPTYSWVVWVDDDILITNPFIALEDYIQAFGDKKDFIVSQDAWAGQKMTINTGLFFMRNNPLMLKLLDDVWQKGPSKKYPCYEQGAIAECIEDSSSYGQAIEVLPIRILQGFLHSRVLQSKWGWVPHVFAAHAAGMQHDDRVRVFTSMAKQGELPQKI